MTDDLEEKLASFEKSKKEFFKAVAEKLEELAGKISELDLEDFPIVSEEEARACETCGSSRSSLYIGPNGCGKYDIYEINEYGDAVPIHGELTEYLANYIGCCHANTLIDSVKKAEAYVHKCEKERLMDTNVDFSNFFDFKP